MSKFDTLCEEILKSLQEGKMKEEMPNVGKDAHVDGKEVRPETGPNMGHAKKMSEKDDVDSDEEDDMNESEVCDDCGKEPCECDKMEEGCGEKHDDDDMNESDDEDDEEGDEMEEGFPNVGDHAHVDGSDMHKKN